TVRSSPAIEVTPRSRPASVTVQRNGGAPRPISNVSSPAVIVRRSPSRSTRPPIFQAARLAASSRSTSSTESGVAEATCVMLSSPASVQGAPIVLPDHKERIHENSLYGRTVDGRGCRAWGRLRWWTLCAGKGAQYVRGHRYQRNKGPRTVQDHFCQDRFCGPVRRA